MPVRVRKIGPFTVVSESKESKEKPEKEKTSKLKAKIDDIKNQRDIGPQLKELMIVKKIEPPVSYTRMAYDDFLKIGDEIDTKDYKKIMAMIKDRAINLEAYFDGRLTLKDYGLDKVFEYNGISLKNGNTILSRYTPKKTRYIRVKDYSSGLVIKSYDALKKETARIDIIVTPNTKHAIEALKYLDVHYKNPYMVFLEVPQELKKTEIVADISKSFADVNANYYKRMTFAVYDEMGAPVVQDINLKTFINFFNRAR